ncbi:MAG: hypothetical protein J6I46_09705 [Ruminococcus sp.]|nr:hypothetical protein [Ruminococcus sp.]
MNRLKTINAVIQFDLIKIRHGVSEKLPMFYYKLREEVRYNPNHDEKGRFASGSSGKGSKSSSKKGLTRRVKSSKISHKERVRLSHQIATDHPEWKTPGIIHGYENRNHFYTLSVNDFGEYTFYKKIPIKGNEEKIKSIRIALGEWGKQ